MIKDEDDAGVDVDVDVDADTILGRPFEELADHREKHGHCNVPQRYNKKQTSWGIGSEPKGREYRLHLEGKKSL
jgi:hypothetical protein